MFTLSLKTKFIFIYLMVLSLFLFSLLFVVIKYQRTVTVDLFQPLSLNGLKPVVRIYTVPDSQFEIYFVWVVTLAKLSKILFLSEIHISQRISLLNYKYLFSMSCTRSTLASVFLVSFYSVPISIGLCLRIPLFVYFLPPGFILLKDLLKIGYCHLLLDILILCYMISASILFPSTK